MEKNSPITQMLKIKTCIDGGDPSVTPIFQNSAFESSSPYFYTRKDNPNSAEFEAAVAILEGAEYALAVTIASSSASFN